MPITTDRLTNREVYQVLKDIALQTRPLSILGRTPATELAIEVEGWKLTLAIDGDRLSHCQHCESPTGRCANKASWQKYGTDPVDLLSAWEHEQLRRLLGISTVQE